MKMSKWTSVALLALSMCAQAPEYGTASIRFDRGDAAGVIRSAGVVSGDAATYALPNNYCYVIHVTAPANTGFPMRQHSKDAGKTCSDGVGQEVPGLGVFNGTYAKGETAALDVVVGAQRRFDLIGLPVSMMPGKSCAKGFRVVEKPSDGTNNRDGGEVELYVGDTKIDEDKDKDQVVFFATGTANIVPGANDVVLSPVKGTLPEGVSLPFGSGYGCNNDDEHDDNNTVPVPPPPVPSSDVKIPMKSSVLKLSVLQNSSPAVTPGGSLLETNRLRAYLSFGFPEGVSGADTEVGYLVEIGPDSVRDPRAVLKGQIEPESTVTCTDPGGISFRACRESFSPFVLGNFSGSVGFWGLSNPVGSSGELSGFSAYTYGATATGSAFRQPFGGATFYNVVGSEPNGKALVYATTNGASTVLRVALPQPNPSPTVALRAETPFSGEPVSLAVDWPDNATSASFAAVASKNPGALAHTVQVSKCYSTSCSGSFSGSVLLWSGLGLVRDVAFLLGNAVKHVAIAGSETGAPFVKFRSLDMGLNSNVDGGGSTYVDLSPASSNWGSGTAYFVRSRGGSAVVAGGELTTGSDRFPVIYAYTGSAWAEIYKGKVGRGVVDGAIFETSDGSNSIACRYYLLYVEAPVTAVGVMASGDATFGVVPLSEDTHACGGPP